MSDRVPDIDKWKKHISTLIDVNEERQLSDVKNLWEYHQPENPATEENIRYAERELGFCLADNYRDFLLCADGWQCFYQMVDLFGTTELIQQTKSEKWTLANQYIYIIDDAGVFTLSGLTPDDLYPIAVSRDDMDLFVMIKPGRSDSGTVIWYAGEEIERFSDFEDFFVCMIEYCKP